jgi:hypothetical protein
MQLGVSTWEAAGFLGMSEKTLRVVYDHRIRCPVHTTSLIFGVAKFPQSSTNYADQFSDTSGESHRQRAPECHSDLGSQNVCAACPCDLTDFLNQREDYCIGGVVAPRCYRQAVADLHLCVPKT